MFVFVVFRYKDLVRKFERIYNRIVRNTIQAQVMQSMRCTLEVTRHPTLSESTIPDELKFCINTKRHEATPHLLFFLTIYTSFEPWRRWIHPRRMRRKVRPTGNLPQSLGAIQQPPFFPKGASTPAFSRFRGWPRPEYKFQLTACNIMIASVIPD